MEIKNRKTMGEQLVSISKTSKNLEQYDETNKEERNLFWQEKLADIEPLDLAFLKLNAHYNLLNNSQDNLDLMIEESSAIGEIKFSFGKETLCKLDELKKKYEISPSLYGQSILALLLNKHTEQERFCISSLISTKKEEDLYEDAYINIISYDFNKINNILDLIKQPSEFLNSLHANTESCNYLPISKTLAMLNKNLLSISFFSRNLDDKIFSFDNTINTTPNFTVIELFSDLAFEQEIKDGEVHYRVFYKLDKIHSDLLSQFIASYKRIFIEILDELVTSNPLTNLSHFENYHLLSTEQFEQTVYQWNETDNESIYDKTIHEVYEEQAARYPENIAIVFEKTSLTYKELNERANRLASYLKQNYKVGPDMLVALCLDRNEHMPIVILAVLKAGGAYVPINPSYPDERIMYILEDTHTQLLLTNELYKQRLDEICKISKTNLASLKDPQLNKPTEIVLLDDIELQEKLNSQPKENFYQSEVKGSNLAYVIYTSGTTGKPKGVMIEHSSYVATIDCMKILYFRDKQHISTYSMTNYAFDMIGPEYGLPLFTGGTIYIGSNEFNYLDCSKYDFIQMTPTLCDLKLECLENIKNTKLLIGAELLGRDLFVKILKKSLNIVHLYGPTETTVWSTSKYYSCDEDINLLSVVLGKPFFHEKVYVLNRSLSPLPIGTIGELYIGGIGLARGYLNKPGLTAERFIPNPFQTKEEKLKGKNARLYKTGDLVRWLPDGNLEYIGRNDFQVKIRGYRVELGEIENSLLNYEGIKQCVVLAREHVIADGSSAGHKYLIGYYVSNSKLDEIEILNYLKGELPEYMVPSILIHLSALPQTINGKLDRKALPEPEFTANDHYIAPRNVLEGQLCSMWAEILHLPKDKVGVHDDFFRLGGDSILAIRLVSKINKDFNIQIKVRDLFELKYVSKLAENISCKDNSDTTEKPYIAFSLIKTGDYKKIVPDINLIEDIYPASFLQTRMLLESKKSNNGTYHIVSNYSVHAHYDKNKLLSILNKLINKHELLRASFVLNNEGKYDVIIFKSIKIDYQVYKNQDSKNLIASEKLNALDFSKPGLFRLIINIKDDNFDLIFSFHHAIEDGWSMATLINEFGNAYINDKEIDPNLKLRYGEFIRNELAAISNQENISFWKTYLDQSNITKISTNVDKQITENSLHKSLFILSTEQVALIHNISKKANISVDSIFFLTYLKTLSYFSANTDVVVGITAHNRLEKEDGDKMFGLFINTIPFRFNFNNNNDNLNQLIEIFNLKIKLQKYKHLPYDYIKSLFNNELYNFVFDFVHLHILNERVPEIESTDGYERTHIPFTLTVAQKAEEAFAWGVSAHDDFVSKEFLDKFVSYYKECLVDTANLVNLDISQNIHSNALTL